MGSKRWCFTNRTCTYTHTQVLTLVLTKAECKMSRVRARLCHPPVNPLPAGASLTCCTGWWKTHCFTYSRGLCLRVCLCCSLKLPLFHVGVVSCVHKTLWGVRRPHSPPHPPGSQPPLICLFPFSCPFPLSQSWPIRSSIASCKTYNKGSPGRMVRCHTLDYC